MNRHPLRPLRPAVVAVIQLLLSTACGTIIGNPVEEEEGATPPPAAAPLPQLTGIALDGLGAAAAGLADDSPCGANAAALGVFGVALGSACFTTPLVDSVLYGDNPDRNRDGRLTCDDYGVGTGEQGILFALLCEKDVLAVKELETLRFSESGRDNAISFADFTTGTAAARGAWTARGPDEGRYPAKIRIWSAVQGETPAPALVMDLGSATTGRIWLDFPGDAPLLGDVTFASSASSGGDACREAPSALTCHSQDIRLKGPEAQDSANGLPSGFRLKVLADDREHPELILLEGKFRYTESVAAAVFKDLPPEFLGVRELYFKVAQNGSQLWGSFDFKDLTGATISVPYGSGSDAIDLTATMKAGVCQNVGKDEFVPCEQIDPKDFDGAWTGDPSFKPVAADYTWEFDAGPPPAAGLVTRP